MDATCFFLILSSQLGIGVDGTKLSQMFLMTVGCPAFPWTVGFSPVLQTAQ